jgi:hypothetical protein
MSVATSTTGVLQPVLPISRLQIVSVHRLSSGRGAKATAAIAKAVIGVRVPQSRTIRSLQTDPASAQGLDSVFAIRLLQVFVV